MQNLNKLVLDELLPLDVCLLVVPLSFALLLEATVLAGRLC